MIPDLTELSRELGIGAVFVSFIVVLVFTGPVFAFQSVARWLSDQDL